MCSNADPRAALAEYIRHKTDNGNQVVDYLHDVLHENLDDVKHGHRERAAAILSEYGDLAAIRFQEKNKEEKKAKPSPKPRKREEREDSEFDAALARVIRDKTKRQDQRRAGRRRLPHRNHERPGLQHRVRAGQDPSPAEGVRRRRTTQARLRLHLHEPA